MRKPITRGHVLALFLLAALLAIMGIKLISLFLVRSPGSLLDDRNTAAGIPQHHALGADQDGAGEIFVREILHTPARAPEAAPFQYRFPIDLASIPIPADPWDMLHWPRQQWRDSRFELFSWDRYPEILIIDLATKAIQERFFHRLAFFAEKAGFRGRLSHDHEIGHLHGWNAHNYRDYDLARFFRIARETEFPLLPEEWELEAILMRAGIIARDSAGSIVPGRGAILTLTRESVPALRTRFMAH
ncbi:MAG: hypothetical protein FWC65_00795, partial [Treponema sp.]|nr:hypothetical protein [Treponema sp.]